jgi:hypothetical protein
MTYPPQYFHILADPAKRFICCGLVVEDGLTVDEADMPSLLIYLNQSVMVTSAEFFAGFWAPADNAASMRPLTFL